MTVCCHGDPDMTADWLNQIRP